MQVQKNSFICFNILLALHMLKKKNEESWNLLAITLLLPNSWLKSAFIKRGRRGIIMTHSTSIYPQPNLLSLYRVKNKKTKTNHVFGNKENLACVSKPVTEDYNIIQQLNRNFICVCSL